MASELVLAPVIDRTALKKTEMQVSQSMEMAGKKASIAIRNDMRKQIKMGVVKGFDDGMKPVSGKLKLMGVAIAAAAGAVIHDTMQKTFSSLDENIDRIMGKLESVRDMTRNAEAFGIDSARYAALSVMGTAVGMDQGDIQGIMAGFVAALKDEEMAGFASIAQQQGTEKAFFDFLSSSAKLGERDRQDQLIATFGEDDFRLVSRFMNPMMQMQSSGQEMSLQTLFKQMTGATLDLGAIQSGLSRTGQAQGMVTKQQTEQLLASIIGGVTPGQAMAVTQVSESRKRLEAGQMSALELQVKGRIIADNMEIKQIEMGKAASETMLGYSSDLMSFIKNPTMESYSKTIPVARMLNPDSLSPEARALLDSGAANSAMTMPIDMITQALQSMVESLNNLSEASTKGLEQEDANKYRTY